MFSMMTCFIPYKETSDDVHVAELFFREVVRVHGLPKSIVSDQGTKFVRYSWYMLLKKMKTNLKFNLSHYPKIDGQTYFVNRSLGKLMRCVVANKIKEWDQILPKV